MLIGGEKWACEACVRGHRVSNCQHSDRPLQHINKKGRPVSRCQHCRTLRKSRSAHVRCECSSNEKILDKEVCVSQNTVQVENCVCHRGARCKCTFEKKQSNPVLASDSDEPPVPEKRRAQNQTTGTQNNLTTFTDGYHKPAYKHNNTAQKYGSPYPAPSSQSLRRSFPPINVNKSADYSGYSKKNNDKSSTKQLKIRPRSNHVMTDSSNSSPVSSPTSGVNLLGGNLRSLGIFMLGEINWPHGMDTIAPIPDSENTVFSSGLSSTSIDWSHYDGLTFNESISTPGLSQTPSYAGFEYCNSDQPPLTSTPTSGELSELDELDLRNERNGGVSGTHNDYGSDHEASEFNGIIDDYRINSASSLMRLPHTQILTCNSHLEDLDAFFKYSNTLSNLSHGLPMPKEEKGVRQDSSPYHDNNLIFYTAEDENEASWINTFSPSSTTI